MTDKCIFYMAFLCCLNRGFIALPFELFLYVNQKLDDTKISDTRCYDAYIIYFFLIKC